MDKALLLWQMVKDKMIEHRYGEWYWGIDENKLPMPTKIKRTCGSALTTTAGPVSGL